MITTQDARGLFTKMLVEVYSENTAPMSFLRSFFRTVESETKEVSIEVQRGTEKLAVDVLRGTEGNRNEMSRSSEKIFVPPYYREYFDATDLDFYDRLFGQATGDLNPLTFSSWLTKVAEKLRLLQDKIERSYEKQCADVFLTGVVELVTGENIDFKRKNASKVVLSPLWNVASDPYADLKDAGIFIRTKGKSRGGVLNAIFGEAALEAFLNNDTVKTRADIRNFRLDDISGPQRDAVGGVLHGRVSAGSFEFNIWTYPEFFDVAGVSTPFIDDDQVVVVPMNPTFTLAFGSVPKIFRDTQNAEFPAFITQAQAAFVIGNYIDERTDKHVFDMKSAGIAIPTSVDQLYTMKVI